MNTKNTQPKADSATAEVAQTNWRHIPTKEGHTISVFYNAETRLLCVDVIDKNEKAGNEIVRRVLNFDELLAHA